MGRWGDRYRARPSRQPGPYDRAPICAGRRARLRMDHQFWYGIVGTNEFEHAWMDEGLNTFSTARVLATDHPRSYRTRRYFGGFIPWMFPDIALSRADFDRLGGYREGATDDVLTTLTY